MFEYTKNEHLEFLRNVFTRWDWGSYGNNDADVWKTLVEKTPITIKLSLIAFTFYFSFGLIRGFLTALKAHTWFDKSFHGFFIVVG